MVQIILNKKDAWSFSADDFISHMVQIIHGTAYGGVGLSSLYIPHGSDNTRGAGKGRGEGCCFISHMVQIILPEPTTVAGNGGAFISHMVQIIR